MKKKIVIIGGGVAGMEAAAQLLSLGYKPLILESSDRLGGHVGQWDSLFPDKEPAQKMVERMEEACKGADIRLRTTISSVNRLKNSYNIIFDDGGSITADAVLIATGFDLFDVSKKEEYGYGIYDRVVSNADLEAWFGGASDSRIPEKMLRAGFVHCVGSRDVKAGNSQCSKVCCMTAIKQAIHLKELYPLADIYCFYMDLRLFGKKYEDYYIEAQKNYGIHFIRGRVSEVSETIDGRVQVKAEDTLSGKPLKVTMDLLVLMGGMVSGSSAVPLSKMLRLEIDSDGFLRSKDNISNIILSDRPGIFLAGACSGTKTVPEALAEARSAALAIHSYLNK